MTTASSPFVGPRPFKPDERRFFFGRDEETEILTSMVVARRASLLFAQSGAGKSSLLMAGLMPNLLEHPRVVRGRKTIVPLVSGFVVARVGRGLPAASPRNIFVQSALLSISGDSAQGGASDATLIEGLQRLLAPVPQSQGRGEPGGLPFVLVFDQFEELFTRHVAHRAQREDFFKQVREALDAEDRLRVLFSMREDYIGELTPYAHLLPEDLRHRFRLERLKPAAALDAVRLPPEHASPPRRFAEGVAAKLVENLQAGTSEDIEPILLQVVCSRVWRELPQDGGDITAGDIANVSRIDEAVIDYYNSAVASALKAAEAAGAPTSERRVRRFFSEGLITPSGTRAPAYRDDQAGLTGAGVVGGIPNVVVDALAASEVNIVRGEYRAGGRWYELAHDRLIGPIVAANKEWERTNETKLHQRAARWYGSGARDSDLANSVELVEFRNALRKIPDEPLDSIEEEFLRRSEQGLVTTRASQRANVEDLGWGVVWGVDDPLKDRVRTALAELLERRRTQTSGRFARQEFDYRTGETVQAFLARHGGATTASSTSVSEMPYYLLIVGDPELIPFEVQYGLGVRHAVGRLYFDAETERDALAMYGAYARSVVAAESGEWGLPRRAFAFAPMHAGDPSMDVAVRELVHPLIRDLQADDLLQADWLVDGAIGESATRAALLDALGGTATPAVVFIAAHGLDFPAGDDRQRSEQGAIVCADWSGPGTSITPDACVAAHDIGDDTNLLGLIAFVLASHSAGTPALSNVGRRALAPRAFVSRLAQRLLGHPKGGALAVIGHVDVNWLISFESGSGDGEDRVSDGARTFLQTVTRLVRGHTVGSATELLAARYKLVASELVDVVLTATEPEDKALQRLKVSAADLRSYIVLGDPATRLPLDGPIRDERPTIAPVQAVEPQADVAGVASEIPASAPQPSATEAVPQFEGTVAFNGVNLRAGTYFYEPAPYSFIAALARGELKTSAWGLEVGQGAFLGRSLA
jgi:hypothetical protein